jgi:D-alanyl-D-alanine carboxypeptidase
MNRRLVTINALKFTGFWPKVRMKDSPKPPRLSDGKSYKNQVKALAFGMLAAVFLMFARPALAIDASIVIDANTDTVISQFNADRLLHPASMSKLMTLYLTFEALEQGKLSLQRNFPVSAHAESMSPTKLNLVAGQTIKVEDAILSLVTLSANDSAVVLAEGLGGSEDRFGQMMTRKAHQLGMVNTNFRNSNGLPDPAQISTARDMAILCRALIRQFPQYYHYFSVREFTYNGIEHANHNHLMSRYEGMDGLKTGLTTASGFNLAASAVRNGRRLIGVVYGGTSAIQRDDYMAELLDDGFRKIGTVAMTTAAPPPVPGRKPAGIPGGVDDNGGPTPPLVNALPPTPTPILTGGKAIRRPADIGSLAVAAGQGDGDLPDDSHRIAAPEPSAAVPKTTGRVAMVVPLHGAFPETVKPPAASKHAGWGIQVGAYATKQATEKALQRARNAAPELLKSAIAVVTPLSQSKGTVYRARLTGLDAEEARKACRLVSHCLTVPPGAS